MCICMYVYIYIYVCVACVPFIEPLARLPLTIGQLPSRDSHHVRLSRYPTVDLPAYLQRRRRNAAVFAASWKIRRYQTSPRLRYRGDKSTKVAILLSVSRGLGRWLPTSFIITPLSYSMTSTSSHTLLTIYLTIASVSQYLSKSAYRAGPRSRHGNALERSPSIDSGVLSPRARVASSSASIATNWSTCRG